MNRDEIIVSQIYTHNSLYSIVRDRGVIIDY